MKIGKWMALAYLSAILLTTSLPAQERIGQINGTLTDQSSAGVPGASITFTNLETGRAVTAKSAGDGTYTATVDPGHYKILVEAPGFTAAEFPDVTVLVGKTLRLDAKLNVGATTQAVEVTDQALLIDTTTTQIAHNVTAEEFNRMPKSRTFQSIVTATPTAMTGDLEGGTQINGASAGENNFIVDGITTSSVLQGQSRTNAPFEILDEIQVKTSGIEAQYGGATGGVISAITKSGGNQFHGDGHYYFTGNGISAGPVKRLFMDPRNLITTGYVQDNKQKDDTHEIGYSLGGYFIKNRLYFFSAASPQFRNRDRLYLTADPTPQRVTISQDAEYWQAYNKISADVTSKIRLNVSHYWSPFHVQGNPLAYNGYGNFTTNTLATQLPSQAQGYFNPQSNYGADVAYTVTPTTLLTVRFGRNWDNYKALGVPDRSAVIWGNTSVGLPFAIPAELQQAKDFKTLPQSRTALFDIATRTNFQVDLNKFVNFGGQHEFKVGIGRMKNVSRVNEGYGGGGYVTVQWNASYNDTATGKLDRGTYGYYTVDDIGTKGTTGGTIDNIYLQDRWRIKSRLSLDLGIRFEQETVPSFRRDVKDYAFRFDWTQKVAPRVGASYDVFGDGRMKVYGSYGLFYDWIKYELARGTFGGDHWFQYVRSLDTLDVVSLGNGNMPGRNLFAGGAAPYLDQRIPSFTSDTLDPNIKPLSVALSSAGVEYQLNPKLVVAARWTYNHLRNAIEDVGTLNSTGSEVYTYGNPGQGLVAKSSPSGKIVPSFDQPRPQRDYNAIELSLSRRFANHFFASGSYVWSRLYGNYAGITSTDEVNPPSTGRSSATNQQLTGSITRQGTSASRYYDLDYLQWDAHGNKGNYGRLASDRPHAFKLYGSYEVPTGLIHKSWGLTEIGGFFLAQSGAPQSTQVMSLQNAPVLVEGRGDMGRAPFINQTDLVLSHTITMGETKRLRFEFNAQNVFNQKTATLLYPFYNRFRTNTSEIDYTKFDFTKTYDYKALIAQTNDARTQPYGAIDPRYGKEDLFRTGFVGRFGVKFSF